MINSKKGAFRGGTRFECNVLIVFNNSAIRGVLLLLDRKKGVLYSSALTNIIDLISGLFAFSC